MPQGHDESTTVTATLRADGLTATTLFNAATTGARFRARLADTPLPVLKRGATVILDNLRAHEVAGVGEAIEAVDARLLYLPAYSPESNPIEQASARLEHLLRTAAARSMPDLWGAIRRAFAAFSPAECRNSLTPAGDDTYEPT